MTSASDTEPGSLAATRSGGPALALAGLAAVLASACCVVPLVLAIVGISGAWISRLRVLEPYSPWLMGLSIASLALAGWRLYRPSPVACSADDGSCRTVNASARRWFWWVAVLALVPLVVPLMAPMFY